MFQHQLSTALKHTPLYVNRKKGVKRSKIDVYLPRKQLAVTELIQSCTVLSLHVLQQLSEFNRIHGNPRALPRYIGINGGSPRVMHHSIAGNTYRAYVATMRNQSQY